LTLFIRDKPSWVIKDEQDRMLAEDDIRDMIEVMKDEFEDKGGVTLEKKVQEIKKQKRQQAIQMVEATSTGSDSLNISKIMDDKPSGEINQLPDEVNQH